MRKRIVLAGACRTAVGKMGGALSNIPAPELGATVIAEALKRAKLTPSQVDLVYMGCVIQAGLGQNPARQASIKAGLPVETPAVTLNAVCGSGLYSVNLAANMILAGEADIVVAGGMENMSMAPYAAMKARFGYRMNNGMLVDTMVNDALWDAFNNYHMIQTADNIAADPRWNITREEVDKFSVESQRKCAEAMKTGRFHDEIVPITVRQKKQSFVFEKDEGPRPDVTMEGLAKLPAINEGGVTTAGNSSGINDGAVAVIVMSEEKAKEYGIPVMANWIGGALAGVDPRIMGTGPIAATQKALKKSGMEIDDIDLYEANEAFAAQSIAVERDLGLDPKKLNVNGGAIALGHPVGASGARILTTLLYEMNKRNAEKGLATLCIGGGMGCSTLVERI